MPAGRFKMGRELGAALAVLAMYVLTLLVPPHQAAATQGDFARLGYQSTASWSICGAVSPDFSHGSSDGDVRYFVKCSVGGAGKDQLTFLAPAPSSYPARQSIVLFDDVLVPSAALGASARLLAEARAPPA